MVDSCLIMVPLQETNAIEQNSKLIQEVVSFYVSELPEVVPEEYTKPSRKPYIIETDCGITSRLWIAHHINSGDNICILLTSKFAKHNYFAGISHRTINTIHRTLNENLDFQISMAALLDSRVTDIDLCYDFIMHNLAYSNFLSARKNIQKARIFQSKKDNENYGLQYMSRDTATNMNPYCKIYSKGWELCSKSHKFNNAYLQIDEPHLRRLESSYKTSKCIKKWFATEGVEKPKSLRELLDIDNDVLNRIMFNTFVHYETDVARIVTRKRISPTDLILCRLLEYMEESGDNIEDLFDGWSRYMKNPDSLKVAKSRYRNKFKKAQEFLDSNEIKKRGLMNPAEYCVTSLKQLFNQNIDL